MTVDRYNATSQDPLPDLSLLGAQVSSSIGWTTRHALHPAKEKTLVTREPPGGTSSSYDPSGSQTCSGVAENRERGERERDRERDRERERERERGKLSIEGERDR